MPDPVGGFTYITEDNTNFFAFVQGPAKGIVEVNELVYSWVAGDESRLEGSYYVVLK